MKMFDRLLMNLGEQRQTKELFLEIIGFQKADIEPCIDRYETKAKELLNQFIEILEDEAKNIPEIR